MTQAPTEHEQALIDLFLERVGWAASLDDAREKKPMLSSGERLVLDVIDNYRNLDLRGARMFVDDEYAEAIALVNDERTA